MKIVEMKNKDNEKVLPDFITNDLSNDSSIKVPSVNVVNKAIEKNVITATMLADYLLTTTSTYEVIPLTTKVSIGDKLTLTTDGKIRIGSGVNYVLLSAKVLFTGGGTTAGNKNITLRKNGRIVSRAWHRIDTYNGYVSLSPMLIAVTEGDLIDLSIYGIEGDTIVYGSAMTNVTVEVVK